MHFVGKFILSLLFGLSLFSTLQAQQFILKPDYWAKTDSTEILEDSSLVSTDSIPSDSVISVSDFYVLQMPDSAFYGTWEHHDDSMDFEVKPLTKDFFTASDIEVTEEKQYKEITFKIRVIDTTTGVPIQSMVYMAAIDRETGKRHKGAGITAKTGDFEIQVKPTSKFEININSMGYFTMSETIDVTEEEILNGEVIRTYEMRPLQKGDLVRLDNLNFASNDYQLNRESLLQLEKLISLMKANPKMVIKLEGHTESTASYESSMRLSQKRVVEVRYYLIRKGIDVHRVKAEGYGNTRPITYGKDEESQKINRRVEFRVLKI